MDVAIHSQMPRLFGGALRVVVTHPSFERLCHHNHADRVATVIRTEASVTLGAASISWSGDTSGWWAALPQAADHRGGGS